MATTLISATVDSHILSNDTNYTLAANGTGSVLDVKDFTGTLFFGQQYDGVSDYYCMEAFLKFDTSSISTNADILDVNLHMYMSTNSSQTDFVVTAFNQSWSSPLLTSDWLTPATMSGMSSIGTLPTSGLGASGTYIDVPIDSSAINRSGDTDIMLVSNRHISSTTPTQFENLIVSPEQATGFEPTLYININDSSMLGQNF